MKKIIALIAIMAVMSVASLAGDLRIGLKAGIPTGVGVNVEYALPMTLGLIAVDGDFSKVEIKDLGNSNFNVKMPDGVSNVGLNYEYIGAGAKAYVPLLGFYVGGNYGVGNLKATGKYQNVDVSAEKTATFITAKAGMRITILVLTAGAEAGITKNDIKELTLKGTGGVSTTIKDIPEITPNVAVYAGFSI